VFVKAEEGLAKRARIKDDSIRRGSRGVIKLDKFVRIQSQGDEIGA
jgi:hypothetical protein